MTAEQTGPNTVLVSWTPPPAPPAAGYQVQVTVGTTISTTDVTGTYHTISVNQFGVYSIRVMSLSRQLPSAVSASVQITVRGRDRALPVLYNYFRYSGIMQLFPSCMLALRITAIVNYTLYSSWCCV